MSAIGYCTAEQYDVVVAILGNSTADAISACNAYNVSQIGATGAALAFTVQKVCAHMQS